VVIVVWDANGEGQGEQKRQGKKKGVEERGRGVEGEYIIVLSSPKEGCGFMANTKLQMASRFSNALNWY